ncbi:Crp/Fnr family transcriptional regulator [Sphingomonas gilva]|nr:Crp/Fnr family transcriptional regulator [Sphingomonas gilva]
MDKDALIRRIRCFTSLSTEEEQVLRQLAGERQRNIGPREDIIREGDPPHLVYLVLNGWACRYKTLEDGRRQILAFLLPGDLCDINNNVLQEMDHSIGAITPVTVAQIGHERIADAVAAFPRLSRALWWHTLTSIAIQREWTVNIGQRSAFERIGHLLCELFARLEAVGLTRGTQCDFPLIQTEIAGATGLTPVHVNRTLQELRGEGLIVLGNRVLDIPDMPRLQAASLFVADYLHLNCEIRGGDDDAASFRSVA